MKHAPQVEVELSRLTQETRATEIPDWLLDVVWLARNTPLDIRVLLPNGSVLRSLGAEASLHGFLFDFVPADA